MTDFPDMTIYRRDRRGIKRPSMIYISATVVPAPGDPRSEASVTACFDGLYLPLAEHPTASSQAEAKELVASY